MEHEHDQGYGEAHRSALLGYLQVVRSLLLHEPRTTCASLSAFWEGRLCMVWT